MLKRLLTRWFNYRRSVWRRRAIVGWMYGAPLPSKPFWYEWLKDNKSNDTHVSVTFALDGMQELSDKLNTHKEGN